MNLKIRYVLCVRCVRFGVCRVFVFVYVFTGLSSFSLFVSFFQYTTYALKVGS